MSEHIETKNNIASSLRVTLDYLANNGQIGWDHDWAHRRESFFEALSSWDEEVSSTDGALKAAFGDLSDKNQQLARDLFDHAYNVGNPLQPTPTRPKKGRGVLDRAKATAKTGLDALKS